MNQTTGRIFRKIHDTVPPIIIDLQDNFSVFKNQNKQRNTFYKQTFTNGIIKYTNIDLDDNDNIIIDEPVSEIICLIE